MVCAFSGAGKRIEPTADVTVDHMVPKSRNWRLVYEWRNYRLACLRMNRKKWDYTVLDPFCIDDDWFVMDIVECRVYPAPSRGRIPEAERRGYHHPLGTERPRLVRVTPPAR